MSAELKPFAVTQAPCPKCDEQAFSLAFTPRHCGYPEEYLKVTCRTCGYTMDAQVHDALKRGLSATG